MISQPLELRWCERKKTSISADLSLSGNIDVLREMISQPLELRWCEQKKDFYLCWLVTQWQYWCSSWNDLSTARIKMMWAKKKDFYFCWLVTQWQYWCSSWNDLSTAWIKMMWAKKKDFYLCWLVTQWQYWCSSWNDLSTAWIRMMWAKKETSISADLSLSGNIDVLREMISQPLELRWCEQKKKILSLLTCHSVAILMFFVKWSLNRLN